MTKVKTKKTKRDKINDVLDILGDWLVSYEGDASVEEEYEEICKELAKSVKVLQSHKTVTHTPLKDSPHGDYYTVKIGELEVRKVRCKKCGLELDPKGFNRHLDKAYCKSMQEKLHNNNKNADS
jgi:hypothetical protein